MYIYVLQKARPFVVVVVVVVFGHIHVYYNTLGSTKKQKQSFPEMRALWKGKYTHAN